MATAIIYQLFGDTRYSVTSLYPTDVYEWDTSKPFYNKYHIRNGIDTDGGKYTWYYNAQSLERYNPLETFAWRKSGDMDMRYNTVKELYVDEVDRDAGDKDPREPIVILQDGIDVTSQYLHIISPVEFEVYIEHPTGFIQIKASYSRLFGPDYIDLSIADTIAFTGYTQRWKNHNYYTYFMGDPNLDDIYHIHGAFQMSMQFDVVSSDPNEYISNISIKNCLTGEEYMQPYGFRPYRHPVIEYLPYGVVKVTTYSTPKIYGYYTEDRKRVYFFGDPGGTNANFIINAQTSNQPVRTISNTLVRCTTNNPTTSIGNTSPYKATLTPNIAQRIDTLTIMMGETDITEQVATQDGENYIIDIPSVTANVSITATANQINTLLVYTPKQIKDAITNNYAYSNIDFNKELVANAKLLDYITPHNKFTNTIAQYFGATDRKPKIVILLKKGVWFDYNIAGGGYQNTVQFKPMSYLVKRSSSTMGWYDYDLDAVSEYGEVNTTDNKYMYNFIVLDGKQGSFDYDFDYDAPLTSAQVENPLIWGIALQWYKWKSSEYAPTLNYLDTQRTNGAEINLGYKLIHSSSQIIDIIDVSVPHCTISNNATDITDGSSYIATITPDTGYNVISLDITMGNVQLNDVVTVDDNNNFIVNIPQVTGDITITAETSNEVCLLKYVLNNCECDNTITICDKNSEYTSTISPDLTYSIDTLTVTMNGVDITDDVVTIDGNNRIIDISQVTNNVVITATATLSGEITLRKYTPIEVQNAIDSGNLWISVDIDRPLAENATLSDYIISPNDVTDTFVKAAYIKQNSAWGVTKALFAIALNDNWLSPNITSGGTASTTNFPKFCLTSTNYRNCNVGYYIDNTHSSNHGGYLDNGVYKFNTMWANLSAILNTTLTGEMINEPLNWGVFIQFSYSLTSTVNYMPSTTYINSQRTDGLPISLGYNIIDVTPQVTYTVTNSLTQCTTNNTATTVNANAQYVSTITPNTGYRLSDIAVFMDNVDITSSVVTESSGTYSINISAVTGDLIISASATLIPPTPSTYTITNNLTNCSSDNSDTSIVEGASYNATISPTTGYEISTYTVTMGGLDITNSVVTQGSNDINIYISQVTGNLVITVNASVIPVTHTITNALTNCTNSNNATTIVDATAYNAVISPNSNCELSTISVTMGNNDITSSVVTTSNNTYVISISSVTDNIVITATATAVLQTFTVTNNLSHCSTNNNATTAQEHSSYTAMIHVHDHYYYGANAVTATMGGTNVPVTYNSPRTTATVYISDVTGNIVINGVGSINTYTITKNITGCTATFNTDSSRVEYGSSFSGTFTATNGNIFDSNSISITMGNEVIPITYNSSYTQATFSIASVNANITITATQVAPIQGHTITITGQNIYMMQYRKNGNTQTIYPSAPSFILNFTDTITSDDSIQRIEIDSYIPDSQTDFENGYEILGENVISKIGNTDLPYYLNTESGNPYNYNSIYTVQSYIYGDEISDDITITINATKYSTAPTDYGYGLCNVYSPTLETLNSLSSIVRPAGSMTTVDYSNRIYKLYKTYVNIPVKQNQESIKLGNYDSTILSDVVATNPITINCGSVTLSEIYQNVMDYSSFTKLEIFLPFIGIQQLDIDVIRNKEVTLMYKMDIVTGKCVALLYVNNSVIYQFSGSMADEIPYSSNSVMIQKGTQNPLTLSDNYPYYIITQNIGKPPYDLDGKPTYEKVLLTTKTGHVQINNIDLSTNATNEEQIEILTLLKQGVTILPTTP